MAELLSSDEWPKSFSYPRLFIRIVELGLTNLEPWLILEGEALRRRAHGMRHRYPDRELVPIAMRGDNDDVACWDVSRLGKVVVIHDYADSGYEYVNEFDGFSDWFRTAIDEMIGFE
jgi:hypothetical protein